MPKFNAKIRFKLILRWFKYVDIKMLYNNKVGKFKDPSHDTSTIPSLMHVV